MSVQRRSANPESNHPLDLREKGAKTGKMMAAALGITMLAACVKPAPEPAAVPPPPPPPPPPVEIIPYRPLPPGGAAYVMKIPEKGSNGLRQTVHRNISDDEKVWHFRAGWNAAALNCTAPEYSQINEAYNKFLNTHQRALKRVNDRLETQFRRSEGSRRAAILAREAKLTKVYNYFSLPPARRRFCVAMLDLSQRALEVPPTDPIAFALANFAYLESPFNSFFDDYETYELESAKWDAKYGAKYGESQAGWVAVQKARAEGNPHVPDIYTEPASTLATPVTVTGLVPDTESGVSAPVIPVQDGVVSQPVVQPIANEDETATDSPQ